MIQLKHIIIIVVLLLTFGFSAKAQSSVLRPFEGSTHTYGWDGLEEGVDYEFFVTIENDVNSERLDDNMTSEFDFRSSPSGVLGVGENVALVQICWNNGASLNVYYVWLEVSVTDGCSNFANVEVVPQVNQFDILSENVPVTNTKSCPAVASDDGFNPMASAYSAGYTTLQFKVVRENGTDNTLTAQAGDTYDWSFIPTLEVDPDLTLGKVIISIQGTNSGVITADASSRYKVNGLDSEVLVTVSIENAPGYTRNVTLTVTEQKEDNTNLPDSDSSNDAVTHTIEVMPVIRMVGA